VKARSLCEVSCRRARPCSFYSPVVPEAGSTRSGRRARAGAGGSLVGASAFASSTFNRLRPELRSMSGSSSLRWLGSACGGRFVTKMSRMPGIALRNRLDRARAPPRTETSMIAQAVIVRQRLQRLVRRGRQADHGRLMAKLDAPSGTAWVGQTEGTHGAAPDVTPPLRVAERFGTWCGEHPIEDVASILRVQF
jgi:hypothetical protein